MLQRILGAVLVVAGLAAIAFGVATATVLRESGTVVATARPVGDGTMIVTDPGVLDLVDDDVTVTASVSAGQEVTVVVGRDVDVLGWLGDDPYARVTGLADWETLSTSAVTAVEDTEDAEAEETEEAEPAEPADPAGSDMWITELSAAEEVSLRWNDRPGPWVLLAAGTGAAPAEDGEDADAESNDAEAGAEEAVAPTLELTWEREVGTPLLWPAVGLGGVLLLVGIVLLIVGRRRRTSRRDRRSSAPGAAAAAADSPSSPDSPAAPDSPATPAAPAADATGGPAWAGTAAGTTWPAVAERPDPARTAVSPVSPGTASPDAAPTSPTEHSPGDGHGTSQGSSSEDATEQEGSGTAPVPVAGRFSRRSRLRRTRSAPEPPLDDAATEATSPDAAPGHDATELTATGSQPTLPDGRPLTRRELRRQEEERRASAPSGMGRALRALTGQTPVVSPADAAPPETAEPPATPGRRAAAWRETWGFDATATGQQTPHDDPNEEGTR
ncbi:hypothetical protein UQW22_11250 [Isoptericola halotolerans]|uniref:hypothetical protein n=1 Tax=Isoptericola halotolerans TaxID=300560 RepID=UPI003890604C